jgi:putative spermidine/putrescine transport system permease protein
MGAKRWQTVAGVGLALLMLMPLVPLAVWSVAQGWRFPALLPQDWSPRAWCHALSTQSGVLAAAWTSTLVASLTTGLGALVAWPAARALGLHDFRGKRLVLLLVLAPALVPAIAIVPGLQALFLRLGLTGTLQGVVLAHLIPVLPYMVLILAATFARLDQGQEEQARSLGARPLQVFRHVTLPLIAPGLITAALFGFLVSWAQYLPTLAIGAGKVQTLPLTLYSFATSGRNDLTGAIAILYLLPGLLALAVTARTVTGRHPALTPGAGL